MSVVEIQILNRRYSLQSDRAPEHVKAVAAFVDEQLRAVAGGSADQVQKDHAILAALNIASELFIAREGREELRSDMERNLSSVQALLDHALTLPGPTGPISGPVSSPS